MWPHVASPVLSGRGSCPLPRPAGNALPDEAQNTLSLPCSKGMLSGLWSAWCPPALPGPLLSRGFPPGSHCYLGSFLPRNKTLHSSSLNFMRFFSDHFSSPWPLLHSQALCQQQPPSRSNQPIGHFVLGCSSTSRSARQFGSCVQRYQRNLWLSSCVSPVCASVSPCGTRWGVSALSPPR